MEMWVTINEMTRQKMTGMMIAMITGMTYPMIAMRMRSHGRITFGQVDATRR